MPNSLPIGHSEAVAAEETVDGIAFESIALQAAANNIGSHVQLSSIIRLYIAQQMQEHR